MNRREQIAKAMYEAPDPDEPESTTPWPPSHPVDMAWWLSRADAALTVFEEHVKDLATSPGRVKDQADFSHVAPTDHHVDHHDDEWEALANLIPLDLIHDRGREGAPQNTFEAADRILAAGFHRTVQGEPTTRTASELEVLGDAPTGVAVQGELSNVSEPGVSDISPAQMSVKGEPSDAQVIAAMNAYDPRFPGEDLDDFQENEIADMRAALRAAAAVRGGEGND